MSMPTVFELIATIKDLHSGTGNTCPECRQGRRFEDDRAPGSGADRTEVLNTVVTPAEWATVESLAELAGLEIHEFVRVAALASHGGHVARIAALEAEVARLRGLDAKTVSGQTEAFALAYGEAMPITDGVTIKWDRVTGDFTATIWKGLSCETAGGDSPAEALAEATRLLAAFLTDGAR